MLKQLVSGANSEKLTLSQSFGYNLEQELVESTSWDSHACQSKESDPSKVLAPKSFLTKSQPMFTVSLIILVKTGEYMYTV